MNGSGGIKTEVLSEKDFGNLENSTATLCAIHEACLAETEQKILSPCLEKNESFLIFSWHCRTGVILGRASLL